MGVGRLLRRRLLYLGGGGAGGRGGGGGGRAGGGGGVALSPLVRGADCAVGSTQWAEPPQYLPAVSWAGLGAAYPSTTRGWGSLYVLVHIGTRRGLGPGLGPQNPSVQATSRRWIMRHSRSQKRRRWGMGKLWSRYAGDIASTSPAETSWGRALGGGRTTLGR